MKVLQFSFIIQYMEKKMREKSQYSVNSDEAEWDDVDFLKEEEEEEEAEVRSSEVNSAKDDVESKIRVFNVSRFELSPSPSMSRADIDVEEEGEDESDSDEEEDATIKESADPTSVNVTASEVERDVNDDVDEDARTTATIGKEEGAIGSQYLEMSRGSISPSSSPLCSST